jgi:hypothetical protein
MAAGDWDFTWLCELHPNAFGTPEPDDFDHWVNFDSFTP